MPAEARAAPRAPSSTIASKAAGEAGDGAGEAVVSEAAECETLAVFHARLRALRPEWGLEPARGCSRHSNKTRETRAGGGWGSDGADGRGGGLAAGLPPHSLAGMHSVRFPR
jgi:hypothetical protein